MTQSGTPAASDPVSAPYAYDPEPTAVPTTESYVSSDVDYTSSDATSDASSYSAGQQYSTGGDIPGGGDAGSDSTAGVAKDQAAEVKDTAVEAGKNVAGTAKEEAANVVAEAQDQAKTMFHTVTSEVKEQAGTQQQRVAGALHSLAKELGGMASSSSESGPLTDLAHQASRKGGEVAHWLENREPSDVLEEVKRFARRRPVTFLLLCGAAGVLAGRLTRGAIASNTSLDSKDSASPAPALEAQPTSYAAVPTAPSAAVSPTFVESDPGFAEPYAAPSTVIDPAESTVPRTGDAR